MESIFVGSVGNRQAEDRPSILGSYHAFMAELFCSYLDESEDTTAGVYAVGGFIGKAAVWDILEPEWLKSLPQQITAFHATDCFTGNKEFKSMDIPDRVALLDKLTDVIVAHEVKLVGYGLDAKTYQAVASKKKQNAFLGNKYAAPLGGVVELACKAMGSVPGPEDIWKVLDDGETWGQSDFVIESNEYSASAKHTIESMRQAKALWFRHRIGKDAYGTKNGTTGIPLLQVADLGAFMAAKYIGKVPDGKIPWQGYYQKLVDSKRIYGIVHADEYSVKRLYETHLETLKEQAEEQNPSG